MWAWGDSSAPCVGDAFSWNQKTTRLSSHRSIRLKGGALNSLVSRHTFMAFTFCRTAMPSCGYPCTPAANGVRNRVRVVSFSRKPPIDIVVQNAATLNGLSLVPR